MTDDIKHILQSIDWPKPSAMLSMNILNAIEDEDQQTTPWIFKTPRARYTFAAGMLGCMAIGLIAAPLLTMQNTIPWLSPNMGLIYYFSI